MSETVIELRNVTKTFGSVTSNDHVSMKIEKGEILALLGENGSGKTSLMNMLSGIYFPDEGEIILNGKPVVIRDPRDAYELGIGMVHQHFKLVDVFTASENMILGIDPKAKLDRRKIAAQIKEICDKYGFVIDPDKKVYDMSVSEKQTLEIVKVLYRGADILILDEPTAVLTPQETERLFDVVRNMKKNGKTVIIITHKLHEVLSISDRVAILRRGQYIGTVNTSEATESSLTEMMVGKKVELNIERPVADKKPLLLEVRNLNCINPEGLQVLKDINFDVYGGEILGIAGISGSGQKELLESIAGLQRNEKGSSIIYYQPHSRDESIDGDQLVGKSPREIRDLGIRLSFVPEDRLGMGLVGSMGMTENMMLKDYRSNGHIFTDVKKPRQLAEKIKDELEVVTPGISTPVKNLSGGNVQKVLVGREIAASPTVLMTAYVVRGLDINTSYTIYHLLNEQKKKGSAVIFVGEDLDVMVALCDRIIVLCDGRINGVLEYKPDGDNKDFNKGNIGLMMTKIDYRDTADGGKKDE
ncbi:MAG: ABC transporter ATP-binding protein [Lachnospiraceae bacterium]|nr:ABC transporter ATP-binding protein [Lachnospiraceae bacterium]